MGEDQPWATVPQDERHHRVGVRQDARTPGPDGPGVAEAVQCCDPDGTRTRGLRRDRAAR